MMPPVSRRHLSLVAFAILLLGLIGVVQLWFAPKNRVSNSITSFSNSVQDKLSSIDLPSSFSSNIVEKAHDSTYDYSNYTVQKLPALSFIPKYISTCRGLLGLRQGLINIGVTRVNSLQEADVVVACNSRVHVPILVKQVFGRKMVSNIIGVVSSYCLGSTKKEQFACRKALAKMDGCDFNDLGIQPPQFRLPDECDKLVLQSGSILTKPSNGLHGKGIEYHQKPPSLQTCQERFTDHIGQVYIANPALLNGFKFDLRT